MSNPYSIGITPRPRLLIRGFGVEVAARLEDLFPTWKLISSTDEVAINEWDAMLTTDFITAQDRVIPIVAIPQQVPEGQSFVAFQPKVFGGLVKVAFRVRTVATIHILANTAPAELTDLIVRDLLPAVKARPLNRGLWVSNGSTDGIKPFALSYDGAILAGALEDGSALCWCLPPAIADPVPWMRAAYTSWSRAWPETFPPRTNWRSELDWMTAEMIDTMLAHLELDDKLKKAIRQREDEVAVSMRAVEEVTAAADRGSRRLLTDQGSTLVDAVTTCLRELGFEIELMDGQRQKGDLLEDLQIRDPDAPGWIALGEVKSHKRGARLEDLLRMSRCVKRFLKETSREPDRQWYVINGFCNDDPSTRPDPLDSNPAEVAIFAHDGGVVIDTRAIFKIRQQFVGSKMDPTTIRRRLRELTGTLTASNCLDRLGMR
jgi:hypothetical protein